MALRRRSPEPTDELLYGADPGDRLAAVRGLAPKAAARMQRAVGPWPALSPAAVNAWLLLVTSKPPQWRDPLVPWPEAPLSVGEPHPGFLYPDPMGFWAEIRRWTQAVVATRPGRWETTEAASVSGLVHVGEEPGRLALATSVLRPRVVLFLDEPAWQGARLAPERTAAHHVPDPHRDGQVYQGFWGRLGDGTIVGKAPQHPAMHRLYRWQDMAHFLDACPP